jgi:hypothetical protein
LYCCENLNRKFYAPPSNPNKNARKGSIFSASGSFSTSTIKTENEALDKIEDADASLEDVLGIKKLQNDYKTNVIEKFESLKKIINQIQPLNYRLEILENIYSLIYLSSNDLKETDEKSKQNDEDDYSDEDYLDNEISSKQKLTKSQTTLTTNRSSNLSESFEILSTSLETNQKNIDPSTAKTATYDVEFSIYATEKTSTEPKLDGKAFSIKKRHSQSVSSNSSRKFYREYSSNGGVDEGADGSLTSLYRNNAGGGGSFLVNDFLCRDILIMVKDLVQMGFKSANSSNTNNTATTDTNFTTYTHCSIQTSSELNARLTKFQQIINETLWRFQIVKCDLVQMEYGKINNLFIENLQSAKSINDRQENMIYELMKERKRRRSSASLGPLSIAMVPPIPTSFSIPNASSFNNNNNSEQGLKRNESKSSLAKARTMLNSNTKQSHSNFRSHESQRSLSLIYPMNKNKRTNMTVMKLLANVETLSTLCLKENKLTEANQLVKMYALKKEASKSFEFREIIFYTVYQKTIEELNKLNRTQQQQQQQSNIDRDMSKKKRQNLIELSMQSLDMAKITENLLSFVEKDDELLKCIFLCDAITISNVDLKVAANLIDYARIKLNQNLISTKANENHASSSYKNVAESSESLSKNSRPKILDNSSDSDENSKKSTTKLKRKMKSN